ncbi:MAG: response regulator, partial [Pseudomonadota bacterium]|nr:response regulator [Pseudomonadota bacterium]
ISRQRFVEAALERAQSQLRDVVLEGGGQLLIDHDRAELSVLLLEDDEVDQLRIQRMLTELDDRSFRLQVCGQIDDAVKAVSETEFDVCLLDYRLPGGTAKDFLDRAREDVKNIPCVLMSGYAEDDVDPAFLESGVFDFLNKDELTVQLLVRSIDYAIERRKVQATIEELSVSSDA